MTNTISKVVDAKGLICPEPIMLLHNAVRDAQPEGLIQLLATDPSTERDVAHFCEFLGHPLVKKETSGGVFTYWIQKKKP